MIKTILFDLDGTLLSMDQEEFVQHYFSKLAKKMASTFDPHQLVQSIWNATGAMIQGNGRQTNEQVFLDTMCSIYGASFLDSLPAFNHFYENEFQEIQAVCPPKEGVPSLIESLKSDHQLVLATNPLFPQIATYSRIKWAGLQPSDFEWVTTYENSHYCKPRIEYYQEIVDRLGLEPSTCLMVGNNTEEDMIARKLGMHVFLLTDHLINGNGIDIDLFPHGDLHSLQAYLKSCSF